MSFSILFLFQAYINYFLLMNNESDDPSPASTCDRRPYPTDATVHQSSSPPPPS